MALSILLLRAFFNFSTLPPPSQLSIIFLYALSCSFYVASFIKKWRMHAYIMDFRCFNPPTRTRAPFSTYLEHAKLIDKFDDRSLEFQHKILKISGLSQFTHVPRSLCFLPPRINLAEERVECESALFGAMDELLASVHVQPRQIGVIVSVCSVFAPTPSITSMIVQKYKLPEHVKSFNLAGMGCSAGLIAIDLAKRVLLSHPNMYALVLCTENLTGSCYYGNERSMLVTNCLFRVGGCAILLSNKKSDRKLSKYRILHTTRSHLGAIDQAHKCVYQQEDMEGLIGIALSKELTAWASRALEHNLKMLGPKVLPIGEIIRYLTNVVRRKVSNDMDVKPYIPKFRLAFDNLCIHAGGKAVVRELEKQMELPFELSEPAHMTLYRFGNLSSASVWYELAYEEASGKIKRGNKVCQIGLGGGFKSCSTVLKALKTIDDHSMTSSCWAQCIQDVQADYQTMSAIAEQS